MTTPLVSTEWDGKPRKLFPKKCEVCPKTFYRPRHMLDSARFCSVKCQSEARKTGAEVECPQCRRKFVCGATRLRRSRSGVVFCSRKCKDDAQQIGGVFQQKHADTGIRYYRQKAIRHHGARCKACGYGEDERMLDADHIDGDRANGRLDNLQVLCVWCHALKTRKVPHHFPGPVAQSGERLVRNQQVAGS